MDALIETVAWESVAGRKSLVPAEAPQVLPVARNETDRGTAHEEQQISTQWFSMLEQIM